MEVGKRGIHSMANGPTSFVPEDVMKLFAQSFSSGVGANEAAQRIGLARTAQNQEFQLGTAKLELQNQELEQQRIDAGARIALQRENIAADTALKGQEIALRAQENAKSFFLKEQAMEQDKLQFAQRLRTQKAADEFKQLDMELKLKNLEEESRIKRAQLQLNEQKNSNTVDYRQAALDRQTAEQRRRDDARKVNLLSQEMKAVRSGAYNTPGNEFTGVKKEFAGADGAIDEDKVYEIAKSRVNRLMDSTGGSTQTFPARTEEPVLTSTPSEEKSSKYREGPLTFLTEKLKKSYADLESGESVVVNGKKYTKD